MRVGEAGKKLIKAFGGVNAVKKASRSDLEALTWLPSSVADAVHARFHPDDSAEDPSSDPGRP